MRSIIHEASSIAKAIEQGWIKAGKPQEFSVKVFEEAETNFLGFTTRKAKVGIFFKDASEQHQSRPQRSQYRQPRPQNTRPQNNKVASSTTTTSSKSPATTTSATGETTEKKSSYAQRRRRRRPAGSGDKSSDNK